MMKEALVFDSTVEQKSFSRWPLSINELIFQNAAVRLLMWQQLSTAGHHFI